MPKNTSPSTSKEQRLLTAVRLAERGELNLARSAFEEAIALDRRNVDLVYNLALLEEVAGDVDRAAHLYTRVLADKPTHALAPRSLSRLVAQFEVTAVEQLLPSGLEAALKAAGVAYQQVADVAARWLLAVEPELKAALETLSRAVGSDRALVEQSPRLTKACADQPLLQLCLRNAIVKHPDLERLLTAVRAHLLLDSTVDRFQDRASSELVLSLMRQGWKNDHAWAQTGQEASALAALAVDRAALLAGDREASCRLMLRALYQPLDQIVSPSLSATDVRLIKPRSLRETIEQQVVSAERRRAAATQVDALKPLVDATSLKVAGQYERAPYPRYSSIYTSQPGTLKRSLATYIPADRLAFMDGDFDVLIAGCGTGQQALQAASAYGPHARLLATDLSRTSLGFARVIADRHGITNVQFLQGDILDCGLLGRQFDVIECVGVLHHMADWRAGWRALLGQLKPGGLIHVGLYSAVSRRGLRALRDEPGYPGPGCTDDAARAWRRDLLLRDDAAPGGDLKVSRDFYNLSAFRDLVLHESEAHVTAEEIELFLTDNALMFRGFTLPGQVMGDFLAATPGAKAPGTLSEWAAFERVHPRTFDGMYRFWVERQQ
jgi:SAM-dependent methyltransferase/tetratricopeptide (TPR) repeat protein